MAEKAPSGRREGYKAKGWITLKVSVPKELGQALHIQSARKNIHYADLIQDLLESHLRKTGLLEVDFDWNASGGRVKSYSVRSTIIEKPVSAKKR